MDDSGRGRYNFKPLQGSATWDPADLATADVTSTTVTVPGAKLGDFAIASLGVDIADLMLDAQVTAANTVTVLLENHTGGNINLGSSTCRVRVLQYDG